MNTPAYPHKRFPMRALTALLAVMACSPLLARQPYFSFNSDQYIAPGAMAGDVELARPPSPAFSAHHVLHPLAPSTPPFNYSGPQFSLGYEVKASEPSNLAVGAEKAVVEDDIPNGNQLNDTISVVAFGDWPAENIYSVAALVVFPTAPFVLGELSYTALNWTDNKAYNDKLRYRWVVRTGGKYYVNATFLGRAGIKDANDKVLAINTPRTTGSFDRWVPLDPSGSMFANFSVAPVALGNGLNEVTAVGFYMDALDFPGAGPGYRQWRLRLMTFEAYGIPAQTTATTTP